VSLIERRQQEIPSSLAEPLTDLTELAISATAQAQTAINELDELIETGFRGKAVKLVERMLDALDKIESKSDKCQAKSRAKLQRLEKELPPVDVIFLYKLIDLLAAVADEAERVGSRLQILLAR
jgi:predicted phosphate transport protein (TIGR00153 family)